MTHPVAILNTSIATADGTYALHTITLEQARELVRRPEGILSAVGHVQTARMLSVLLGIEVPENRILFEQQPGQTALVFKLRGRPPEGQVLSIADMEAIGYDFKLLTRLPEIVSGETIDGFGFVGLYPAGPYYPCPSDHSDPLGWQTEMAQRLAAGREPTGSPYVATVGQDSMFWQCDPMVVARWSGMGWNKLPQREFLNEVLWPQAKR